MTSIHPHPAQDRKISRPALRRTAVNIFIAYHLVAIWVWCLPKDFALRAPLLKWTAPYIVRSGLWQHWTMFSPNPRTENIRVGAEITYANGSVQSYEFPQMDRLGYMERYRRERFRKWANDNLRLDDHSRLWPPAARWVARLHSGGPQPVSRVRLVRRWSAQRPPAARGWNGRIEAQERTIQEYFFHQQKVEPGKP